MVCNLLDVRLDLLNISNFNFLDLLTWFMWPLWFSFFFRMAFFFLLDFWLIIWTCWNNSRLLFDNIGNESNIWFYFRNFSLCDHYLLLLLLHDWNWGLFLQLFISSNLVILLFSGWFHWFRSPNGTLTAFLFFNTFLILIFNIFDRLSFLWSRWYWPWQLE